MAVERSKPERLANHVESVGRGLSQALSAYNSAIGSYETRLPPSGRRLAELGLATGKAKLDDIQLVEGSPRCLILNDAV